MSVPDPACFEPDELEGWLERASFVNRSWAALIVNDPCQDCTVAFSREMMAQGRCNGIPGMARKVREAAPDPGWRERNRRDYFRRRLHDLGLDPDHALRVG